MHESELYKTLHDQIVRHLEYTDTPRPPAIITFCGIPGSGKTSLATRLARDLQAQYVQTDALRRIAREQLGVKKIDVHVPARQILNTATKNHVNKLIIFDCSIDRTWREFLGMCQEIKTTPIIIRIAISPAEANARMQKRGRNDDAELIEGTERRQAQFLKCREELLADVEVSVPFDYQAVLDAVHKRLATLA